MIQISTKRFEEEHGKRPSSGFKRFAAVGATTGRRKAKALSWAHETDGPWSEVRERVLKAAREAFGTTADITVELLP